MKSIWLQECVRNAKNGRWKEMGDESLPQSKDDLGLAARLPNHFPSIDIAESLHRMIARC